MTIVLRLILALAILGAGSAMTLASADEQRAIQSPPPLVQDPARAVIDARRALLRSPLDDRALERLVRADDAARRWDEERRLVALSNRLTKRNLTIRFMALSTAAADGDLTAAVRDADLLLRQRAYEDPLFTFLRDAAAFPEGRQAIARRLAAQPSWRADLLIRQRGLIAAGHIDAVALLDTMQSLAPPTFDEAESLARTLVDSGDMAAARALRRIVAPDRNKLLIDGHFARRDPATSGLLGWSLGTGIVSDDSPGLPLVAQGGGGASARQIIFAPPGRHRLTWTVDGSPDRLSPLRWTIRCMPTGQPILVDPLESRQHVETSTFAQSFTVIEDCPAQIIEWSSDASMNTVSSPRLISADLR